MGPAVKLYAQWKPITAQIIDSNGTSAVREYISLADAVEAYDGNGYIKMTANTEEPGFTLDKDVYLDLDGKTVTFDGTLTVAEGKTLYGMDSTTDTYDGAKAGKIVGKVNGIIAPVFETKLKANEEYKYHRYVAIQSETGYSFHRFNISVTGYRFELAAPQCALFFIGKFQGDKAAKDYLTSLGFTLKDKKDKQLGKANYEFTAGTVFPDMPAEGKESTSEVVRSGDAYLFEAYLMRSFDKENHNGYTEEIGATAQATFDNGGKQDSETQWLSFEEAWKNAKGLDETQQEILDNFREYLGIPKQTE